VRPEASGLAHGPAPARPNERTGQRGPGVTDELLPHAGPAFWGCKPKPPKIPSPQLQLRAAIAQVGGKKELTGRTDIEIEISNPCARLIANAIIYYNSAILSRLLTKYEASGNAKALALIKKLSPAAWRHIHLNGHYPFRGDGQLIDLDAIVAGLELG
jgi:hypothetical protein